MAATSQRKAEYDAYINSAAWQEKRGPALERAENRCQVCNTRKNLDVHHRTYERFGDEKPGDLTVLCRRCHALFHDQSSLKNGRKGKAQRKKRKPQPLDARLKPCSACYKNPTTKGMCKRCRKHYRQHPRQSPGPVGTRKTTRKYNFS